MWSGTKVVRQYRVGRYKVGGDRMVPGLGEANLEKCRWYGMG